MRSSVDNLGTGIRLLPRIILALLPALLLASVLLNGCASIRESPSAVVREFVGALQRKDIDTALTYVAPGFADRPKLEELVKVKWSRRVKDFRVQTRQNDGKQAIVADYYEALNEQEGIWSKLQGHTILQKSVNGWLILYPEFL